MGEFSKLVGDIGEAIVTHFMQLFGWQNKCINRDISCHTKSHNVSTHGIDALMIYKSALEQKTIENILISSKYSSLPYKSVVSKFKSHFEDIAHAIECYSKSPLKKELCESFTGITKKNDIGVLFYLNNDKDPDNQDIVSKVARVQIDSTLKYGMIHVIDNKKATFLFNSLSFVRSRYGERNVLFYCPSTSLNIADPNKTYQTAIMPVEFITAPVIPLVVNVAEFGQSLCLVTSESLTDESLEMLIDVAREISSDFAKNIIILFPQFDHVAHKNIVDKAKLAAAASLHSQLNIEVSSFNQTFSG